MYLRLCSSGPEDSAMYYCATEAQKLKRECFLCHQMVAVLTVEWLSSILCMYLSVIENIIIGNLLFKKWWIFSANIISYLFCVPDVPKWTQLIHLLYDFLWCLFCTLFVLSLSVNSVYLLRFSVRLTIYWHSHKFPVLKQLLFGSDGISLLYGTQIYCVKQHKININKWIHSWSSLCLVFITKGYCSFLFTHLFFFLFVGLKKIIL